jgi:hypothetical protein
MMMLADTYGMMPSAKIERFATAPPENRLKRPSRPLWPRTTARITLRSTPGVVMKTPTR